MVSYLAVIISIVVVILLSEKPVGFLVRIQILLLLAGILWGWNTLLPNLRLALILIFFIVLILILTVIFGITVVSILVAVDTWLTGLLKSQFDFSNKQEMY